MKTKYKSLYKTAAGHERIMLHTALRKAVWDDLNTFCRARDIKRVDFVESIIKDAIDEARAAEMAEGLSASPEDSDLRRDGSWTYTTEGM